MKKAQNFAQLERCRLEGGSVEPANFESQELSDTNEELQRTVDPAPAPPVDDGKKVLELLGDSLTEKTAPPSPALSPKSSPPPTPTPTSAKESSKPLATGKLSLPVSTLVLPNNTPAPTDVAGAKSFTRAHIEPQVFATKVSQPLGTFKLECTYDVDHYNLFFLARNAEDLLEERMTRKVQKNRRELELIETRAELDSRMTEIIEKAVSKVDTKVRADAKLKEAQWPLEEYKLREFRMAMIVYFNNYGYIYSVYKFSSDTVIEADVVPFDVPAEGEELVLAEAHWDFWKQYKLDDLVSDVISFSEPWRK